MLTYAYVVYVMYIILMLVTLVKHKMYYRVKKEIILPNILLCLSITRTFLAEPEYVHISQL